jgi:hypothetical protein
VAEHDPQDKLNPSPIFELRRFYEALHATPGYAELKAERDRALEYSLQAGEAFRAADDRLNDLHDRTAERLFGRPIRSPQSLSRNKKITSSEQP